MTPKISFVVESENWRKARLQSKLRQAAALAWKRGASGNARSEFAILLTTNAKLKSLNAEFRGKDRATNVLSFPASGPGPYLGDIALAYGVTAEEAKDGEKPISAHASHLVVHGVLHLLGYDHQGAREARKMEALEIEILAELGIGDPYAVRRAA